MKARIKVSLVAIFFVLATSSLIVLLSRSGSLIVGNVGMNVENQIIRTWTFKHLLKAESSQTTDRILEGVRSLAISTDDTHLFISCLNYLSAFQERSKFDQWIQDVVESFC
jgi:hypothetical protein